MVEDEEEKEADERGRVRGGEEEWDREVGIKRERGRERGSRSKRMRGKEKGGA